MADGPLKGVRVLDFGRYLAAPFCAQILGDYGADVIKLEVKGSGDPFRAFGGEADSPTFTAFNRNKRSLALDLSLESDRTTLKELIATADVFIENARPGAVDRLDLGFQSLSKVNERLIYCSISGMGQTGPYAQRPVYDTIGQAMSGLLALVVDPTRPEIAGPAFADTITGLTAVSGILAALVARDSSGEGQFVDVSMLAAMVAFLPSEVAWDQVGSGSSTRRTRASMSQAFALACADSSLIALHLSSSEKFWQNLIAAVDSPPELQHDDFLTYATRVDNYEAIETLLRPIFARRVRSEWLAILEACDVPHAPIYSISEMKRDPQAAHLGLVVEVQSASRVATNVPAPAVRFGSIPPQTIPPIAQVGEHNEEIREELRRLRRQTD